MAIDYAYRKGRKCMWVECDSMSSTSSMAKNCFLGTNFGIASRIYTSWNVIPTFIFEEFYRNSFGIIGSQTCILFFV
ncbi:hypothetical protein Lal_00005887 [Lupinus albus]|nr:hypothetical protein Lal_00005887 [Lupinus albus]